MGRETIVSLFEGGTDERTVPISSVTIPDLWHIAEAIRTKGKVEHGEHCASMILECWHLAHALKKHIEKS